MSGYFKFLNVIFDICILVFALIFLLTAYGLWYLKNWARYLTICTSLFLLFVTYSIFFNYGSSSYENAMLFAVFWVLLIIYFMNEKISQRFNNPSNKAITNCIIALTVLLSLLLFFLITNRFEYYINSGTLEYKKKIYVAGILVMDKVEQTKLSQFIRKNEFIHQSNFIQIKEIHPVSPPFSFFAEKLNSFEKYLIPLYDQKLIDKNETKILINHLTEIIEMRNGKALSGFLGDFLAKHEDIIVENMINYTEPGKSK